MPVQTDQILQVDKLIVCTDGGTGNSTLSAAHAVGATTINVVSSTGFAVNDPVRIGEGEDQEVYVVATVPGGSSITIAAPGLKRAHAAGEPIVEQVADQYGPITDAGFTLGLSREAQKVFVASQRLPFAILKGYGAVTGAFQFAALTLFNAALAAGIPRARILGAGTAADPLALINAGNDFGTIANVNLILEARTNDLQPIRVELYGCAFDFTSLQLQFARGVLATPSVKVLAGGGAVIDYTASPFTGTTTYVATNAAVLDGLDNFGYFAAHGTPANTTVSSGGAAGANTVVLASGTSYAPNDWVKFGSGNTVEFHQVESVVTNTLTLRTRFLRAQASGVAVQRQSQVVLSSITTDGVQLTLGGQVNEVRGGLREMAVGYRPGNAEATTTFGLTSYKKASFAIAAGKAIPAGNVVDFLSGLGTVNIDGFYATGLLQGGNRFWYNAWGCQVDLAGLEVEFSNAGDAPAIPVTVQPLSGIQLIVSP